MKLLPAIVHANLRPSGLHCAQLAGTSELKSSFTETRMLEHGI